MERERRFLMARWEDGIALEAATPYNPQHIGGVSDYLGQDAGEVPWRSYSSEPIAALAARDPAPLPSAQDREGYYGSNHFNYWASGFVDYAIILQWLTERNIPLRDYMDMGCASGRVLRHFASQATGVGVIGCDINRRHVDWCAAYMPPGVRVFQNTSLPHLPLPDECLDLVTAFSVFTHVESFDTSWMIELRRLLRPGGVAWVTIHGDRTWREIDQTWPLYVPLTSHPDFIKYQGIAELPEDRLVFRWVSEASYSANVFYRYSYIRKVWGRFFDVVDIFPAMPAYQDVVVLRRQD
jgi:SAM-dependent methyltransferase